MQSFWMQLIDTRNRSSPSKSFSMIIASRRMTLTSFRHSFDDKFNKFLFIAPSCPNLEDFGIVGQRSLNIPPFFRQNQFGRFPVWVLWLQKTGKRSEDVFTGSWRRYARYPFWAVIHPKRNLSYFFLFHFGFIWSSLLDPSYWEFVAVFFRSQN